MRKASITAGQGCLDVFIWRQFGQITKCCNGRRRLQHTPSYSLNILLSNLACASNTKKPLKTHKQKLQKTALNRHWTVSSHVTIRLFHACLTRHKNTTVYTLHTLGHTNLKTSASKQNTIPSIREWVVKTVQHPRSLQIFVPSYSLPSSFAAAWQECVL